MQNWSSILVNVSWDFIYLLTISFSWVYSLAFEWSNDITFPSVEDWLYLIIDQFVISPRNFIAAQKLEKISWKHFWNNLNSEVIFILSNYENCFSSRFGCLILARILFDLEEATRLLQILVLLFCCIKFLNWLGSTSVQLDLISWYANFSCYYL